MVETFVKQLMDDTNNEEVVNLSLNCLTLIYKNDNKSAALIEKYYQKLLELSLMRYKMGSQAKQGQSVGSFITHLK
jgi:ABC-type molybdate transport system substrate-binding protein